MTVALRAWLERVFFGGAELSVLSTPSFAVVVFAQVLYPDAVPLAGLTAIVAGSVALAAFRAGSPDVGDWPRRSELTSAPLRFTYFSVVFFIASMGVGHVAVALDALWLTPLGGVVQVAGLAAFPAAYHAVHGEPVQKPVEQL
ncbi:MAG: hypothetical protein V5A34_03840 [Halapricum sp.]